MYHRCLTFSQRQLPIRTGVCKYVRKWHHSQLISVAQTYNSACCSTNFFGVEAFRRPSKETWKAWVQVCQAEGVSATSIRKCLSKYGVPKKFFPFKQGVLLIRTSTVGFWQWHTATILQRSGSSSTERSHWRGWSWYNITIIQTGQWPIAAHSEIDQLAHCILPGEL